MTGPLNDNLVSPRPADSVDRASLIGAVFFTVDSADPSRLIPVTSADLLGTVAETGAASEAKLEQVRALLAGTLTMQRAAQATNNPVCTIAAGASLSAAVDCGGRTILRLIAPANWTNVTTLTFQTSHDNVTYSDLYDADGNLVQVTVAAGRSITLLSRELVGINWIKVRSGTPTTPVNQTNAVNVTLLNQSL